MTIPALPTTGFEDIDGLQREDERVGFGNAVVKQLQARGFVDPKHVFSGKDARIYAATRADGMRVAVRVTARFAAYKKKNRCSLGNMMRTSFMCRYIPHHPNLVRFLDWGRLSCRMDGSSQPLNVIYWVMPFLDGPVLRSTLQDRTFLSGNVERIRTTVLGILEGLTKLHRRGLRHGDLGPTNVIMDRPSWRPVIIDFRLSTHIGRQLDHDRSDIHRLIREMLTGQYRLSRRASESARQEMLRYWAPLSDETAASKELHAWMDFADSMEPERALGSAQPPQILAAARAVADRFA